MAHDHSTRTISKVLIANRGEIAVRIIRAAKDSGIGSVAVYADSDSQSLFVELADEAFALNGSTPAETYLDIDKIMAIAERSGADAVHPGYGFLSENPDFARTVVAAGLLWIGPPPEAIEMLGDKVTARHIAQHVGAPQVPGTSDPVGGADEIVGFAREHGLPVAIKAAYGGGGRGLKVARTLEEIPAMYDSATREAITAFGRGECFVERYLDRPRHVETQCLADRYGTVVVASTRDCSLQRRHQKLLEEAPAPFLTDDQLERLHSSSKAILREAGYVGAGTCEFLVGRDGTISFLEVNTRLQVEHPVTEEVSGLDLVREQFRIACGGALDYPDPAPSGHAFEFRINAEDPGRGFMPAPGTLTRFRPPCGPGVRMDEGYRKGMSVPGAFDSLVAKLVVSGPTREIALQRSRRALAEFRIEGMPTVVPFHERVVVDPAFTAEDGSFGVFTDWIETEFDNDIPPYAGELGVAEETPERRHVVVEVNGRRLEVVLPSGLQAATGHAAGKRRKPTKRGRGGGKLASTGTELTSPMQGTIIKTSVIEGQHVEEGETVLVLEAMKMEQPIAAHRAGTVHELVAPGTAVASGDVLCQIADE
ncbi:acetyl/propionyl/methylcrotonyl-CoA carboxylase subunit alpha [Propionibacterium acidifaciens]|uniref:acetyl/propionyl/methylcrotonyl-CoA carboxylase subunit alpha n=1 Tax=Propionibacterium acidifaciens TaxID=556499 RepID=UPI0028DCDE48|nr:biotin carboxylase N-terminal domain-containing protein [Propionibacterium acidifaciens]